MAFITSIPLQSSSIRQSVPNTSFLSPIRSFQFSILLKASRIPSTIFKPTMTVAQPQTAVSPFSASVGTSMLPSDEDAIHEAIQIAQTNLSGEITHAIISCTVDRDTDIIIKAAIDTLPTGVKIHGATTCGAVLTNTGPLNLGVGVLLLSASFGSVSVASASVTGTSDMAALTSELIKKASSNLYGKPAQVLIHTTPGDEEAALMGVRTAAPSARVFGGSVADNTVEGNWRVLTDMGALSAGVSVMLLGKDVPFGACLLPPYVATEVGARVTKAEGRTVYQIDGRPAGEVLRDWVGESIEKKAKEGGNVIVECAGFPLGVEKVDGGFVGIHAAGITQDGAVELFAEVKEGEKIVVMKNMEDGDSVNAAAVGLENAYQKATEEAGVSNPAAGMIIYCGGLSIAVGDRLGESLKSMDGKPPMLGITAFGEQGCINGKNVHSNLAVGVAVFGQKSI